MADNAARRWSRTARRKVSDASRRVGDWRRRTLDPRFAPALAPVGARAGQWRGWVQANDPVYRSIAHPGLPEKITASVTLLLIAAVVIFLMLFDWNWLRGPISNWASAKYDREIEIKGDLDVNLFSWTPSATVEGVRVGGPDWSREQDTLVLPRAEASVRLRKLFAGQIEMPLLSFTRPTAVLLVDKDGRQSWALNPDAPETDEAPNLPAIQRLLIEGGHITINEQRRGITLDATITAREVAPGQDGESEAGFQLLGSGSINRTPLKLEVRGGPFINVRRDRPYEFTADLSGARSRLTADGSVTRPFDLGRFNATLTLQGQDLADLYALTTITTPNTPPYRLSGTLTRDDTTWTFNDFTGRVGSSDLSGDVKVSKPTDKLRVDADLVSRSLDIDDLLVVLGGTPKVTPQGTVVTSGAPGRLLPDAPLQVERLRSMDGNLSYRALSVKANDLEIRQVRIGADLKDAILDLDPVSFSFSRGTLNGTARINATRDTPYSALDFRLAGYPLESIIPAMNGAPTVTGRALGRARLEGPGASIHALASNAKGSVSLVVPQGEIRQAFAELLGINVGKGLSLLLSKDNQTTPIRCAVADFTVSGGTATAKTFVIDTGVVIAQGSGTINLETESLNLKIDGETKEPRLLRVWAPITIRGPMVAPRLGVEGTAVAAQVGLAGLLGTLITPLAALLPFVDPGLAEDANCGALIAGAR